jgi:cysteinyl-tRNA synthetase
MSREHIGHPMDIKGGGKDLVYPHHESEAAICEALSKKPYARVWMHNGFVTIGEAKMSKSLHNFVPVREALALNPPGALRLWVLSLPYREPLAWGKETVAAARNRYDALVAALAKLEAWAGTLQDGEGPVLKPAQVPRKDLERIEGYEARFAKAMDNDFDTPAALAAMEEAAQLGVKLCADGSLVEDARKVAAEIAVRTVSRMNQVLQILETR